MMKTDTQHYDCIIIGAGISGIMAARKMTEKGLDLLIVDKGRGVGGRMATRVAGNLRFDHGAQIIEATSKEFALLIDHWLEKGVLRPGDYPLPPDNQNSRVKQYHAINGIAELPRYLAQKLNVKTSCRIIRINFIKDRWAVETTANELFTSDAVIMTPPVPQSLELIGNGKVVLPEEILSGLSQISYEPCIALLLAGEFSEAWSKSTYIKPPASPISLIVNNHIKAVSPQPEAITVHATRDFSELHWKTSDEKVIGIILNECKEYLQYKGGYLKIHRWRYSRVINSHPEPYVIIESPGILAFAGDGFSGRDIEGAALSGLYVAEAVVGLLA